MPSTGSFVTTGPGSSFSSYIMGVLVVPSKDVEVVRGIAGGIIDVSAGAFSNKERISFSTVSSVSTHELQTKTMKKSSSTVAANLFKDTYPRSYLDG
jgi:hypothetical protein